MDYHKLSSTDHKKNIFSIIAKSCRFYEITEFIQTETFITCYLADGNSIRIDISTMESNDLIILTSYLNDKFFATKVIHNEISPLIKVSRVHELFDAALEAIDSEKAKVQKTENKVNCTC